MPNDPLKKTLVGPPQDSPGDAVAGQAPPHAVDAGPEPLHVPLLRRLRLKGRDRASFGKGRVSRNILGAGLGMLAALAALPFLSPDLAPVSERLDTLLSLVFLLSAIGLWLGMRRRAFAVAGVLVMGLYGLTAWTTFAFPLSDIFIIALVASFLLFALAGFYLVFVLEEVVFDTHRFLHLRSRGWVFVPLAACAVLVVGLPWWHRQGGLEMDLLWLVALIAFLLMAGWWFLRAFNDIPEDPALRELHLFVISALAAATLADVLGLVRATAGLVPSVIAYLALLGTWVYVSYTTLQRTHFLLLGNDPLPWMSLLLSASFAIVAHAQVLYRAEGSLAVEDLVQLRIKYLVIGVWIGIAFFVVRSLARALRTARSVARPGGRSDRLAQHAESMAAGLLATESRVEIAAFALFREMDRMLPGAHQPPQWPAGRAVPGGLGWEFDTVGGARAIREDDPAESPKE